MIIVRALRLACAGMVMLLPALAAAQQDHAGHGHGDQQGGGGMCHMMQSQSPEFGAATGAEGATVFVTIQRVVRQLQVDPGTNWDEVDIAALRQHLVDMEMLSLYAQASMRTLDQGAEFSVTGDGRTLQAIQRMVPTHAAQIQTELGWRVQAEATDSGVNLRVESDQPGDAAMIQALGFLGFMTLGEHHELHHLTMAGAAAEESAEAMDHGQHGAGGHQGH